MLPEFTLTQIILLGLLFLWTGFVRTGLGFGGAALGLPLMLFLHPDPLLWLPIISVHLLFFSGLTLRTRLHNVDWKYLYQSAWYIIPPAIVGVFGLVNLPTLWLNIFIYSIALFYGFIWMLNRAIESHHSWVDKLLLILGGYVAGTSLTGAPLMVAVYMRNVSKEKLRDTLFVLWFILVSIKMSTFIALGVKLNLLAALALLPVAAIGHVLGLKAHETIMRNDATFKRWVGGGLVLVSALALWRLLLA
ncbi:MAG: TSUP family transporter [Gammaproteobacteria bacterium]|nr:TSUP family transporter [Gammaproteobacteria bacterium]